MFESKIASINTVCPVKLWCKLSSIKQLSNNCGIATRYRKYEHEVHKWQSSSKMLPLSRIISREWMPSLRKSMVGHNSTAHEDSYDMVVVDRNGAE